MLLAAATIFPLGKWISRTPLKTDANRLIHILSSNIISGNNTNFPVNETRRIDMLFCIGYSDDIE
jgi:small-conductance mechanosensitive channel